MKKPFVSFIVMAYNAEKFIAEALDGAFAQTYDNMEIIISDDCSTDNTFSIIQEKVKAYKGEKTIRVLQNEKNLGISAHLNKLWWEEAKGEWIVVSAGDDVSLPLRTTVLAEHMNTKVALIHSKSFLIDENSQKINYKDVFHKKQKIFDENDISKTILSDICVRGATMAINKKMLNLFGPFQKDVVNEDVILAYRSQFYGEIIHIEKELMLYRDNSEGLSSIYKHANSFLEYKKIQLTTNKWKIAVINQILYDNSILQLDNITIEQLKKRFTRANIIYSLYSKEIKTRHLLNFIFWKEITRKIFASLKFRFYKR